jgi:pyruvate/2-oxoglutarate dehydrogenase complex dihydrolipoamide dehydrogenase (E3) component
MDGCTLFSGHARFEAPDQVRVNDDLLSAPRVFINVGGRANVPDIRGITSVRYLTNTNMVALDRLPQHLVVVGGSYVGLEFAQMYRRFGADVTVVEMGARLVSREDEDVSDAIESILTNEGIQVRTNAECISVEQHQAGVAVGVDCTAGEPTIIGSDLLLAVGRRPNTHDLGLDRAGVATDKRGYITVDDKTTSSRHPCLASGLLVTAMAVAHSRTRRTTTSRLSRRTSSTAATGRCPTASRRTRSTSIRRSAVSA